MPMRSAVLRNAHPFSPALRAPQSSSLFHSLASESFCVLGRAQHPPFCIASANHRASRARQPPCRSRTSDLHVFVHSIFPSTRTALAAKIRTRAPPMTDDASHESGCWSASRGWLQRALPGVVKRNSTKGSGPRGGRGVPALSTTTAQGTSTSISAPFNVTMTATQNTNAKETGAETRAVTVFCASSKGQDVAFANAAKCTSRFPLPVNHHHHLPSLFAPFLARTREQLTVCLFDGRLTITYLLTFRPLGSPPGPQR